jgi:hypothetical protein
MFADHLAIAAELFQAANAEFAGAAVCQIMYADAIARRDMLDIGADFFDPTCDFVSERYRQTVKPRNAGAIMFVGMADPACRNPNQNIGRTNLRKINLCFLQRFSDASESHRSHAFNE